MFGFLAIVVYLAAIGIPVYLLYRFHAQAWGWHVLAILAAMGLGMLPTPLAWTTQTFDLALGFLFVLLLVWGLGGLFTMRPHRPGREKHA